MSMGRFWLRRTPAVLIIALIAALIAAACGNSSGGRSNNGERAGTAMPAAQAPASDQAPTRTVTDAYGETTIPAHPQRVVVLNTAALDNLLAMGVKPIGAPYSISVNANFFKHLAAQTDGIANTGTVDQPNLETIAKLQPDLIIGQKADHDAVYEDLKRIAPVYMTVENVYQWKTAFRGHAQAVNKQPEAEKLLAAYEGRIAKFKSDMGGKLTAKTVSLIRPRADHVRLHSDHSYAGSIVAEAGLPFPDKLKGVTQHHLQITEEQIADMDADVIISFGRESEADYFTDKIQTNPIWKTLQAVKNNEVHMVEWEVWLSGQGIQAANLIIDDLYRFFVK